jgi:leucyl aminopeptidase
MYDLTTLMLKKGGPALVETALIVPFFEGETPWISRQADIVQATLKSLAKRIQTSNSREFGKLVLVEGPEGFGFQCLIGVWLGARKNLSKFLVREAFGSAQKYLEGLGIYNASIPFNSKTIKDEIAENAMEGYLLAAYKFEKYKSFQRNLSFKLSLFLDEPSSERKALVLIQKVKDYIETVYAIRDMVNEPPNFLNPDQLKKRCLAMGRLKNVKVKAFDSDDLLNMKMEAILAVGKASDQGGMLLTLEYLPRNYKRKVALVGKGVTFDTGGYSLKDPKNMLHMKGDMLGAAMVINAVEAAATKKSKTAIVGIIPLVENLIGPKALKPDEVIKTYSGQTVEVVNTDAEGRLILADALSYAAKFKPDEIIDMATISGISHAALGDFTAFYVSNNDRLAQMFDRSAQESGERFLRVPLAHEYLRFIKSDVADLRNVAFDTGGALINSGLFLKQFVNDIPWLHIDLAGVDFHSGEISPIYPKGSSGFGTKTLLEYLDLI